MVSKTNLYVVTSKGVTAEVGGDELVVGAEVALTDQQALGRVNKVTLKSAFKATETNPLEAVVEALEADKADVESLLSETVTKHDKLIIERDELKKALKKSEKK